MGIEPPCPQCGGRNVGKVGTGQFFCRECYIEFAVNQRGVRMYRVELDGELSRIDGDSGLEGVAP